MRYQLRHIRVALLGVRDKRYLFLALNAKHPSERITSKMYSCGPVLIAQLAHKESLFIELLQVHTRLHRAQPSQYQQVHLRL